MEKRLNEKLEFFVTTEKEAEELIGDYKEDYAEELQSYSFDRKSNKAGEYVLVKIKLKYNTPAGIMESELYHEEVEEENEEDDLDEDVIDGEFEDIDEEWDESEEDTE